ncbi:MAG: cellulase family glycosylhydrolase, partial [Anaerolineales bacterium]|nr:cellulase family glycosylhydrolase [Anaerolineales bacterium]
PHVILEIFNEPASITAADWRRQADQIVAVIREAGADQLVIVGGVEYGRDLSWVASAPLADDNLAYAAHIYPVHSRAGWPNWFGGVAERHPVLITEWGFMETSDKAETAYLVGNRADYGEPFLEYLDARGIGWIACWYDDAWLPLMLAKDGQGYTPYGDFVVQQLTAGP